MKRIFASKTFWIVIAVVAAIRLLTPILILDQLNKFLGSFSLVYAGHVDALGISVWRGAYQFRDFELRLKDKPEERFVIGNEVDVSIAWRELFAGKITTDVVVNEIDIVLTQKVIDAIKNAPKKAVEDTQKAGRKLFPVRVERVDVRDSSFEFAELLSIPESKRWKLTQIEGRVSNVTPTEGVPLMFINVTGALFDTAKVKIVAQLNQQVTPLAWDADLELREFELKEANAWLKRKLPLTFTSGKLDLYAEARSIPGGLEGYLKPFLKKADVVAAGENFLGLKHFGIEVSTAAANLILRTAKDKTLATKVLFAYEKGEFKVNSAKAINEAIKNGFGDPLPPGIDDEIGLNKKAKTETGKQ